MPAVAVVTGAARGMGDACARALAPHVDALVLADLGDVDTAAFGTVHTEAVTVDVADAGQVAALAVRAAELGEVRWLVHAAGVSPTMGDARRMLQVDLVGSLHVVESFGPVMTGGGSAVLFASMAAHAAAGVASAELDALLADPLADGADERFVALVGDDPGFGYAMAKRGVILLAQRSAPVWGQRGVRINSVSPGSIATPMGHQELEGQPMMRTLLEQTPLQRLGERDEVVGAVEFLLSDAASYITGSDLLVDGGAVAAMMAGT